MRSIERFGLYLVALPVVAAILFWLHTVFIWGPVSIYTEGKCLELGMPRSAVTWDLKQYCMNLEGTVTVNVESLAGE